VAALLLFGCTTNPVAENVSAKPLNVGWVKHVWRLCEEDGSCPHPTPKTVVLPAPPVQAPMPIKASPPSAAARNTVAVHFEFAQAIPTKEGVAHLEKMLSLIRENDALRLEGRTDDLGGKSLNDQLARERAEFVAGWLKHRGVKNPMKVEAQGKCCYVAPNDAEEGRATNRRVEIHFISSKEVYS
jgi:outer membrane protein OmpA-like peptidoglycan-associated protein